MSTTVDAPTVAFAAVPSPRRRQLWPVLSWTVPLAVQMALSARLIWSNTAFSNEALYLYAGHQELQSHLNTLGYETYFSGAPLLYPVLGAFADSIGGLALARIVSLVFMLAATVLLYRLTNDLFGRLAGFFAALSFVVIAPTQFLGAFATYDPMAFFLLTASAYCAYRATRGSLREGALVLSFCLLLLADFTKYATTLYDPIVLAIILLNTARTDSSSRALKRTAIYLTAFAVAGICLIWSAGRGLWQGINYTTLSRATGVDAPSVVLRDSIIWIGLLLALALLGVVAHLVRAKDRTTSLLLSVFLVAALLATINQARIHTATSLHKHDDFGAWFAAVAVGYLLAWLCGQDWRRIYRAVVPVGLVVLMAILGVQQANQLYRRWPNVTPLIDVMRPLVHYGDEHYLVEEADLVSYCIGNAVFRNEWKGTGGTPPRYRYKNGHLMSREDAWREAVREHYYSVIMFSYAATPTLDESLIGDMKKAGYHKVAVIKYVDSYGHGSYTVWSV
jgi:hypothetical protein